MPWARIKALLRGDAPSTLKGSVDPVEREISAAAGRCAAWMRSRGIAPASDACGDVVAVVENSIARIVAESPSGVSEAFLSDAAAMLGQALRQKHGGVWGDHALLGLVLRDVGGIPGVCLAPLAMVQKKAELRAGLSLERFMEGIPKRLETEKRFVASYHAMPVRPMGDVAADWIAAPPTEDTRLAMAASDGFRAFWRARFGSTLPLTLQGVRELERFLRSQFFFFALREETLVQMGCFVGEVGRGLYQGTWSLAEARTSGDPARAALTWPELPYYPVGRVLRLIAEQPENDALDEYLRLVPSARSELRKGRPSAT